jgi:hypothetical protein
MAVKASATTLILKINICISILPNDVIESAFSLIRLQPFSEPWKRKKIKVFRTKYTASSVGFHAFKNKKLQERPLSIYSALQNSQNKNDDI